RGWRPKSKVTFEMLPSTCESHVKGACWCSPAISGRAGRTGMVTQEVATKESLALANDRLSYSHGTSDVPLIGTTIGDLFDRVVEQRGDHTALISRHQDRRYMYRQLRDEVDAFARGLMRLGVAKGDRLGIWSPNHAEWIVTQFATAKIGAILVNVNPAYRVQ